MKCDTNGHVSALCPGVDKLPKPIWVGYGNEERGFFHVAIPEEKLKKPTSNVALVTVDKGNFSAEELEEEFKELVDESWNWQVCKLNQTEFTLVFPSKELLRMASRGGGISLPITEYRASVTEVLGDPRAAETLEVVWVKLKGVPEPLREEKILFGCTLEIGTLLEVDSSTLADALAPIRMKFGCRKPVVLKPFITLFINLQGYRVDIERLDAGPAPGVGPVLPPPPPPPPRDDAEDDSSDGGDDEYHRKRRKRNLSPEGSVPKGGATHPTPTDEISVPAAASPVPEGGKAPSPENLEPLDGGSLAAIPELPKSMFSQYGSNFTPEGNVFKTLGAVVHASSSGRIVAHSTSISEAPPLSTLSDSLLTPSLAGGEVEEADSARTREWRRKRNQDRSARAPGSGITSGGGGGGCPWVRCRLFPSVTWSGTYARFRGCRDWTCRWPAASALKLPRWRRFARALGMLVRRRPRSWTVLSA